MTNFDRVKDSKNIEELALAMVKAVDRCAVYFPFIDEDDTEDLRGNICFENFKKWLIQEASDDEWLGITIGDI